MWPGKRILLLCVTVSLAICGFGQQRNKNREELPKDVYAISQPIRHISLDIAHLLNQMRDDLDDGGPFSVEFKLHDRLANDLIDHLRISELKHGDRRIFICLERGYYLTSEYAAKLGTEALRKVNSKAAEALPQPITEEDKLSIGQMRNVMVECTVAIDSMVQAGDTYGTWRCDPKRVDAKLPGGFDESLPKSSTK